MSDDEIGWVALRHLRELYEEDVLCIWGRVNNERIKVFVADSDQGKFLGPDDPIEGVMFDVGVGRDGGVSWCVVESQATVRGYEVKLHDLN